MSNQFIHRITLEEISKEINVSRTTIYNVVNGKGSVSLKTREKVLNALRDLHYVPNQNARDLAMNKQVTVALIDYDSLNASYFRPAIAKGIKKALEKYGDNGLDVKAFTASPYSPDEQEAFIDIARQQGIKDFVIVAANPLKMQKKAKTLRAEGCHAIMLSKPVEGDQYDAFIGIDDYMAGKIAAELMGKFMSGHGTVQILLGERSYASSQSLLSRCDGFTHVIRHYFPNIILNPFIEELNDKKNIDRALQRITRHAKIDGIYDLTYHPDIVASYIKDHCSKRPILVCMDLFEQLVPYVADGTVDAVIFQDIAYQAEKAIEMLFEFECYGKQIQPGNHFSRLDIVIKNNLSCFV